MLEYDLPGQHRDQRFAGLATHCQSSRLEESINNPRNRWILHFFSEYTTNTI